MATKECKILDLDSVKDIEKCSKDTTDVQWEVESGDDISDLTRFSKLERLHIDSSEMSPGYQPAIDGKKLPGSLREIWIYAGEPPRFVNQGAAGLSGVKKIVFAGVLYAADTKLKRKDGLFSLPDGVKVEFTDPEHVHAWRASAGEDDRDEVVGPIKCTKKIRAATFGAYLETVGDLKKCI